MAGMATPGRSSRPLLGVLFMGVACALFPIMNGIVKLLALTYDPLQIVWFRITLHLVLVAAVFLPRLGLGLFRTRQIGWQFVSSVTMLLSTLFFFSAVKYVPVAEAIAVTFVSPLVVVFLAWPMLGERITPLRLAAVILGFAGVLVVIRPGGALFQWASVLLLGSATCYSIYQIVIRRVAGVDHPATSIFYSVLLGAIIMSAILPFVWKTPVGGQDTFSQTASNTDWHTYTIEWIPGRAQFFLDGVLVGTATNKIPATSMHWVLQSETVLGATPPLPTASATIQIDWITMAKRA